MIPFMDSTEKLNEADRCLDSQLWHACAGGMVQMPPVNSKVFYFAQGHAEHASEKVDFRNCPRFPPHVLCKVASVRFMADPDTDEVFAKISLIPVPESDHEYEDDGIIENETHGKPASFAKTLTQSDANNGGGFSVPRYCAETIFPRLDYKAEPPVQTILVKDVNGVTWKFRHIYRGTPRRHLLTTGWSTFVNHKKLVAGDSIVFLRAINGDLCVGIRRAKRGIGGLENSLEWNPAGLNNVMPYGGFSAFLKEEENRRMKNGNGVCLNSVGNTTGKGKLRAESVIEAATLAANGQPFEVTYYPRASTPEFCVKASLVKAAMYIHWCSGMRFKMAFETEDSSRISWFMGTIFSVQVADPIRWPDSPWRLLQVTWDEPNLLQNVKCVNPWLVELVSNMPTIHLSSFSQPRKKPRLSKHPDFPLEGQLPLPSFSGNLLGSSSPFGNTPAGIQGARHARYGLSLSKFHFNKVPCSLFRAGFPLPEHLPNNRKPVGNEDISCSLTMGNSTQTSKNFDERKAPRFILFGQPILTEEEILQSLSGDTGSAVVTGYCSSGGNLDKMANVFDCEETDQLNFDTGHCKVFLDSDDLGRTLDISLLGSYDELYERLAGMFGLGKSEILNNVLYRDANGVIKRAGEETFREFATIVKRLMIITDSGSDNLGTKEK